MQTLFTNCTIYQGVGSSIIHDAFLLVSGSNIAQIGSMEQVPETDSTTRIIDGTNKLLMPGLINGHNHCAMTLFRGLADDLELEDWLHNHIFPAEKAHANPEMVYWCTKLAVAEMFLSGTTCVADAYFFSSESARALSDCSMRGVVGHGIVDFPAPSVPDPKKNIEAVAKFLDYWQERDELITPAVFAHAPYTCSPRTLIRAKELADRKGARFFTHLAESRKEPEIIIELQADTPLQHLDSLGLLDDNSVLIHSIWLNDDDLNILAKRGAHVITCPQSNLKLASGRANIPEMINRNISVGLGTDGCASNNSLDMFKEMDFLAKLHKGATLEATTLPASTVLESTTTTGAKILGLTDLGYLDVGKKADLILLDPNTPHLTPMYNADLLVYSARGSDVHSTMINGRMVMENRKILSFDLEETVTKVQDLAQSVSQL